MELVKKLVLKVNPFLTTQHLQYYHQLGERQARRLLQYYRDVTGTEYPTFEQFYHLVGAFPCPKFVPVWREVQIPSQSDKTA